MSSGAQRRTALETGASARDEGAMASLRRAMPEDAAHLSRLFAAAYARDPVFSWLARKSGRAEAMTRFFLWVMRDVTIPRGETWVVPDKYAAASWIPPYSEAKPETLGDNLKHLSAILSLTGATRLLRGAAMAKAIERAHPPEPYFYLAFVGVAPRLQGEGVGTALLQETLARVDAAGMPAFLENSNPRNIKLYERLGFKVTDEIVARPDAPPLFAMLRPGKRDLTESDGQGSSSLSQ